MKITEHMQLLQVMVDENPNALGIMVPADSVKAVIKYGSDRRNIQKRLSRMQIKAGWYKEQYNYMKAELKRRENQDDEFNGIVRGATQAGCGD